MKILIVDDHPVDLLLLRTQLEVEGHGVVAATDGVEALKALGVTAVDGVVSDALMPNMDGFRLCREIRQVSAWKHLPFVLYTGTYDSAEDRELALDVGADHFLTKPSPVTTLVAALQSPRPDHDKPGAPDPAELGLLKNYNARLVAKLEQKNGELEKANAKLRASETRYQGTLDRMLEGCQIIGRDWRYLYLNEMAATHGRKKREELLGRTFLECFPELEKSAVQAEMQRCMREGTSGRVEHEHVFRDGSAAWFELSLQPVPEGLFVLSLDVTEHKRAVQKIQEQLDELLRWQEVMLGREERVQALKAEVNELCARQGQTARYALSPPP